MNKTILMTGAGGGIATALAKRLLAKGGYNLSLVDIDAKALDVLTKALNASEDTVLATVADVTKEKEVDNFIKATVDKFGAIDGFANNVGTEGPRVTVVDTTAEQFDRVYQINLRGVFLSMRGVLRQMQKQRSGAIVNACSLAGIIGFHSMGAYTATKHGVAGLTRSAAMENAEFGIRVNAILPGVVNTEMMRRIERDSGDVETTKIAFENASLMKRYAEPEEIAALIDFLLSDDASYITQSLYTIDGGTTGF